MEIGVKQRGVLDERPEHSLATGRVRAVGVLSSASAVSTIVSWGRKASSTVYGSVNWSSASWSISNPAPTPVPSLPLAKECLVRGAAQQDAKADELVKPANERLAFGPAIWVVGRDAAPGDADSARTSSDRIWTVVVMSVPRRPRR